MNVKKQFSEGLVTQNPALVQLLGMCPLLAITTSLFNGLGMGVMVIAVLTCSNVVISALRKIIPSKVRIACYIVVIAGFVTMVDLLIKGFVPALSSSLGLFIPLIVVNCVVLGRAEGFASKNSIGASALDGIFQGIGYTVALVIMCVIREFLGAGTFGAGLLNNGAGFQILPTDVVALGMVLPVGGFLTLGVVIAVVQYFMSKPKKNKEVAKYWKVSRACWPSPWLLFWSTTSSCPSSWASAPSWACPRRSRPHWAWAWRLPSLWVWPPRSTGPLTSC